MSYTFSGEFPKSVGAKGVFHNAEVQTEPLGVEPFFQDHKDAIENAISTLIDSLGSKDANFKVTVKGHANPGHVSTKGWAEEFIDIRIDVVKDKTIAEDVMPPEGSIADFSLIPTEDTGEDFTTLNEEDARKAELEAKRARNKAD